MVRQPGFASCIVESFKRVSPAAWAGSIKLSQNEGIVEVMTRVFGFRFEKGGASGGNRLSGYSDNEPTGESRSLSNLSCAQPAGFSQIRHIVGILSDNSKNSRQNLFVDGA